MSELVAYLTVLVAAAIPWLEVLLVVPAGIVAGLPPLPVIVVASVGNIATLVPLVYAGDRVRTWLQRRRRRDDTASGPSEVGTIEVGPGEPARADADGATARDQAPERSGRGARALRVFDRFGLVGLAALGPLLTGVHVAALVALAAGAPRRPTVLWLSGGVVVWAGLAAGATALGLDALVDPDQLPDLGLR